MQGNQQITFSALFLDTVETHGLVWAHSYYTKKGMSEAEFKLWVRVWCYMIGAL